MISTNDFKLAIDFLGRRHEEPGGPYMDWIDVRITVEEPGVAAAGTWSVMPSEMMRFRNELNEMTLEGSSTMTAELNGVEQSFGLTLHMLDRGAILGEWRFQPVPPDGASITGRCGIDQSFLAGLIASVDELLSHPPGSDSNA